eukprot:TRINITY_DN105033_c0_g1_i1.p1 TRINITY_DN105033_c0_g1~~TRINITY_DN105033_c0_g1_i1.p1  ORF type:complete len:806 (+),score=119.10 TRINITY_DN105033_c0_g1_i1:46-2463(+)
MDAAARQVITAARKQMSLSPWQSMCSLLEAKSADLQQLPPSRLCRLAWAAKKLDTSKTPQRGRAAGNRNLVEQQLLLKLAPLLSWTSSRDAGDTAWAYASAGLLDRSMLIRLLRAYVSVHPSDPVALANILWATTRVAVADSDIIQHIDLEGFLSSEAASNAMSSLGEVELARTLWSLGSLRVNHQVFERINQMKLSKARPQCLANIFWACARVGRALPSGFHEELCRRAPLPFKELTACLWALAASGDSTSPVWHLTEVSLQKLPEPSAAAVGSLLWAHAKALQRPPDLLLITAHQTARENYDPKGIANALWALARTCSSISKLDIDRANHLIHQDPGRFKPQEFANCLWAIGHADKPAAEFFQQLRLPNLSDFEDQHLSNIVWAFAAAGIRRVDVLRAISVEVLRRTGFTLQGIANIAWAFVTLRVRSVSLFEHLRQLACNKVQSAGGMPEVADVQSLLGILWALGPNAVLEESLRQLGKSLDGHRGRRQLDKPIGIQPLSPMGGPAAWEPRVTLSAAGARVIFKPAGWAVDVGTDEIPDGARPLSAFASAAGLCKIDASTSSGFVNRLDTPSSGLILQATCFEGLFHLQVQRELGLLERDYVALCLGWVTHDRSISARVRKHRGISETSVHGRPALTKLKVLAHLTREDPCERYSMLALTIESGRTHQIRCHLAHIGHPIAGDARYGKRTCFGTGHDLSWPGRHFLHRSRLAFTDLDGNRQSVPECLPQDLQDALAKLQVVRGYRNLEPWLRRDTRAAGEPFRELSRFWQPASRQQAAPEPLELPWHELAPMGMEALPLTGC